jgi:trehalose 6-phosphate phosphatase
MPRQDVVTYLFSRANRDLLATFARSNVLLAFDFDGTLAPIVGSPAAAALRESTRRLLKRTCRLYPCAVISGRARDDVRRRLRGVKVRRVVGNHGAEPSARAESLRRRVRKWLPVVRSHLSGHAGVIVEDKQFSLSVHYRNAPNRSAARQAIHTVACSLDDARIVGGKLVVNLMVPDAPHKGLALERERQRLACDAALYVGDDRTDEDVFRFAQDDRLLSVRVGQRRMSMARCYIADQQEIDRLLRRLVALRTAHVRERLGAP